MERSERSHWPALLLFAVVGRLSMAWLFLRHFPANSISLQSLPLENVFIALSLHAGQGFSSPFGSPSGPTALLGPGYPFFIYVITALVGVGTAAVVVIVSLQIVFSVATMLAVMWVAKRDFGTPTSNLAGLICACSIPFLFAPIRIWETSLSALVLVLFLCIPERRAWSAGLCALGGAICGVVGLVNPALLPSLLFICLWHLRHARAKACYLLLGLVLALSPWIVRNYVVLHAFIPVRDSFGFELWVGNHPPALGDVNPKSSAIEMQAFLRQGEIRYIRSREAYARQYIQGDPAEFLRETGRRIFQFWCGTSGGILGIMFTVLGLLGLLLLWRKSKRWVLYAVPMLLFPLPYYITHSGERYRYVLDPILVLLTSSCLKALVEMQSGPSSTNVASPSGATPV